MSTSDIVSLATSLLTLAAVIVSAVAAHLAKKALEAQVIVSKNGALVSQTQQNEEQLGKLPQLFGLYNIDLEDLKNNSITPEELLFVWSDLRQGEIFHRMEGFTGEMISDYRANFLRNPKVQSIFFKYISGRLMSNSPYIEAVRRFIQSNPRRAT